MLYGGRIGPEELGLSTETVLNTLRTHWAGAILTLLGDFLSLVWAFPCMKDSWAWRCICLHAMISPAGHCIRTTNALWYHDVKGEKRARDFFFSLWIFFPPGFKRSSPIHMFILISVFLNPFCCTISHQHILPIVFGSELLTDHEILNYSRIMWRKLYLAPLLLLSA